MLKIIGIEEVPSSNRDPVDAETLAGAAKIISAVRAEGDIALHRFSENFGDLKAGENLIISAEACKAAFDGLPAEDQALLERTAERIRRFATAQRRSMSPMQIEIPGGHAGHDISPMDVAGCYAPGGRFPLPSSVLMTVVTAKAAGVVKVVVASPKPTAMTLAAAHVAGADLFLAAGGAQAIAAMAYGTASVPACDVIVGPGNRWVTAAKQLVSGRVAIDMLAGPSELVVFADDGADATTIAADLLAQAEHDTDAVPILVTTSPRLIDAVNLELATQLEELPTKATAREALKNGYAVAVQTILHGIEACNRIAPEHLEVMVQDAGKVSRQVRHYGGLFIGAHAAEVLGDYGMGPNHVLPTGGTARYTGGLSVATFLRIRTWMRVDHLEAAQDVVADAVALARHEGLEGHARSAQRRLLQPERDDIGE